MFCPKCGSMLLPKNVNGKMTMSCPTHGSTDVEGKLKEKSDVKLKNMHIREEAQPTQVLTENECPKCNHDKAYYWVQQTRAADEAPTRFYRCEKCKHTWKEYS